MSSNNSLPFLDADAQSILRIQRDIYNALHWQQGKWVWDVSEEENIVYLWTFSGEKINRVIEILLSTELDAEINCDYRQVKIDFKKIKPRPISEIQELLSSFKTIKRDVLESIAMEKIQVKWFSKFSDCLPDPLAKQTIFEKDYDLPGMMRELSTIKILPALSSTLLYPAL